MKKILLAAIVLLGVQSFSAQVVPLDPDAAEWVRSREARLETVIEPVWRIELLSHLAPAALQAGETEKARAFAEELFRTGEPFKSRPGFASLYSGVVFTGHSVLGLIALQAGDVEAAKAHLLAAARISGTPALRSFGPNMLLAKALLERGEREAVLQYFDLCAGFWKLEKGRLERWKADVRQNKTPDLDRQVKTGLFLWRYAL